MNVKDLANVLMDIQENRMISYDIIVEALKEGLAKAYRKHIEYPDVSVDVEVSEKGEIKVYHNREVVEGEVEDDYLELSLVEAKVFNPEAKVGDTIAQEVSIEEFGRTTVSLVKNVLIQKIKEANKQMVYDEYIDKIDDMVYGTVQTVEEKYTLIDLGKTLALMPKSEQIPNEVLTDGQRVRVIIKSVNKDSKGAQVLVSRSSANLVKRLFEASVIEIFDGTIEIKGIAREAGERTKMAVVSKNPDVEPVGSCIGPKGTRIADVLQEITVKTLPVKDREKIDVIKWEPNICDYVKSVMEPAKTSILAVLPQHENPEDLLLVVEDDKLSQAIGRRGINVKLAVKLLERKIDIKTKSEVEEMGIDWYNESLVFEAKQEAIRKQKAIEELEQQQALIEEERAKAAAERALQQQIEEELPEDVFAAKFDDDIIYEPIMEEDNVVEETVEEKAEETPVVTEEVKEEEKTVKRRKPKLESKANEYVSKYEELADAKKASKQTASTKKKKTSKEDEEQQELKKKIEELKNQEYTIKPEYTDEELEKFEEDNDNHWYNDDDVDFDEFEDYYD